jgi:hypothetical protein
VRSGSKIFFLYEVACEAIFFASGNVPFGREIRGGVEIEKYLRGCKSSRDEEMSKIAGIQQDK